MSVRSSLVFQQLNVRRTPGIETPYVLDDLSAGINITYGPNASGKSTTAQVLQMLLWSDLPGWSRASLAGHFHLDGSEWSVDIDAGSSEIRRDGNAVSGLPLDGSDYRDRYVLTLHDLLQVDDSNFAAVILRESAGGYDIDAAREMLGYREKPSQPRKNRNALRAAQRRMKEALDEQRELIRQQQDLDRLRDQLAAARSAAAQVDLLEKTLAVQQRMRELGVARSTLDTFPEHIALLSGDELNRLAELDERQADYEQRWREHETELQRAEVEIAATGLDDAALPDGFLTALKERARLLQEISNRCERARSELEDQTRQRDHASRQLGRHADASRLRALNADALRELVALARSLEQARAEYDAAEALRKWLGAPAEFGDIDRLSKGISLLNGWLRSSGAPVVAPDGAGRWLPALVAAALIALLSIAGAIIGHILLLGGMLLAVVPIALAFLLRSNAAPATGHAALYQEEYRRLGLEQPRSWSVEQVHQLVEDLGRQLHEQQLARARAERWDGLEERWRQAAATYQARETEWRAALESFGLEPAGSADLYAIAQNVDRWQDADAQVAIATQSFEREHAARNELLGKLNADLALAGYEAASDPSSVLGHVNDLDERLMRLQSARQTRQAAQSVLETTIKPELQRIYRSRRELFDTLGLEVGDTRTLTDWVERREAFIAARGEVEQATRALRQAEMELGENRDFIHLNAAELEARLAAMRSKFEEADGLQEQITRIETLIERAKQSGSLEQAIVEEEQARDVLRADRDEGYRLAAGWQLAQFVRERTRDRDRPQVFHRARELFVRMTQGRYKLEFSDASKPEFRAIDTTTNANHGLDELSSATRVQLLMAVRMAFVEEMEHGPKLPLILDETLGNADEHRAEAIIRAVCEISRSGRQVFYFTAQLDEVSKWRRLLSEHADLPHRVISLVEARKLAEAERSILEDLPPATPTVPAPNGATHVTYREVLGVPPIDTRQDVERVHLWYLVPDPGDLHHLLTYGISTWGQLRTLMTYGGGEFIDFEVFEVARARADVIRAAIRARRIGHGRLVDRAAVLDSDAFTPAFVNRVIREVERAAGDAENVLRRLESGAVIRLRTDYIEKFRVYLSDEGYLDPEDPLEEGDVRARVLGEAAEAIASGRIDHDDVEFLLHCVPPLDSRSAPSSA